MKLEIKLFLYTKILDAIYNGDFEKIQEVLFDTLHTHNLPGDYWKRWVKRYETITLSKEVQIALYREAGYSYRQIKDIMGVSPNTVQRIISQYEIDYKELEDTHLLENNLKRLDARLRKVGITI